MSRRGRRRGHPDTRQEILAAARDEFGKHGYDGTTIRGVAAEAGVNAALVLHFFGSKEQLFTAALDLPSTRRPWSPPCSTAPEPISANA
jgi:AcrR family transcriptional regulator